MPVNDFDSTARFSDRVDDYVRFRPDYPAALMTWLQSEQGFSSGTCVADVGAGTGISSKMLLDAGCDVIAIEPNAPMRAAAEQWLHGYAGFEAVDGRANATGLADASVDWVTVAQAFHWFDPQATRTEFARVLRPGGKIAIWWNSRRLAGTPFLEGYETLLQRWGTDYVSVAERYPDDAWMREWFGTGFAGSASFPYAQRLDFNALRGRLTSSSYVPKQGDPRYKPMIEALHELFESCAEHGTISFDYDTRVFAGQPV